MLVANDLLSGLVGIAQDEIANRGLLNQSGLFKGRLLFFSHAQVERFCFGGSRFALR